MPQIEVDTSYIENLNELLEGYPKQTKRAMANALNRTISKTITYIHEEVSNEYAVKRKGIERSLSVKKATTSKLEAQAISRGHHLKLSAFKYRKSGPMRIASVQVKKGPMVKSKKNPPLFVGKANKTTGKQEIWTRDKGEQQIGFGFTLGIPQMVANPNVYDKISLKSSLFLSERFNHELWVQFEKLQGRL